MQLQCNRRIVKHAVALLFLITSSYSKIQINVKQDSSKSRVVITHSGVDDYKVTDKELREYNLTESNLKQGIKVELGKLPNNVFLRDPTPYSNLYKKYNWMEVKRSVRVKKAKVFERVNENITLAVQTVINNTTRRIKKKIELRETVEYTVSSFWLTEGIPDDYIVRNINLSCGEQYYLFEHKRKDNRFQSVTLSLGVSNIGYMFLDPGQKKNIELSAVKSTLLLTVDYSVVLIGNVIADYAQRYGKYHFWTPKVESVMNAAKLKNEMVKTEFIEIRCLIDPRIKIVDKYTHQ